MSGKFYSVTELKLLAEENKATDLIIDGISIEDTENITWKSICYFTCYCGLIHNKTIKGIKYNKSKLFCKKCTVNYANKKHKKTCLEKYGVESPFQSQEFKNKGRDTCLEKYGSYNAMHSKILFDKCQKSAFKKKNIHLKLEI